MQNSSKIYPLIVIAGPTATGKTSLSVNLSDFFDMEIINADSRQVYKYMDIGTCKPTIEERRRVVHHLLDIVLPDQEYNAGKFTQDAEVVIKNINSRNKIPFIVGGTGLYIKALTYGLDFIPGKDDKIRLELKEILQKEGTEELYQTLQKVDPDATKNIHPNDFIRILRALEIYYQTGKPVSSLHTWEKNKNRLKFRILSIGLYMERKKLYETIRNRVDKMIKEGWIDEVRFLLEAGYNENLNSLKGIGYKQICQYLKGELKLNEATGLIKRDTCRYAKRQMTWFRNMKDIIWFDITDESNKKDVLNEVKKKIESLMLLG